MGGDGSFGARIAATGGLYVSIEDVEVLEFVEATPNEPQIADSPGQGEESSDG
jgi:hypothetical protein